MIIITAALTLIAITVVHYFLTMPTEVTPEGQGANNTSATNKLSQVTSPVTSSNSATGWIDKVSTVLKDVLSNVTHVIEENSNISGSSRSLISASLPQWVTVEDILHAVIVNNSAITIGNHTFRYALLSYCILGECREVKETVSLGQYTVTLQAPPKTTTTTGGQLTYVLIRKEGKLVGNVSHYYIPFLISNHCVTITMNAINLGDNHVMYFLQIYGLPTQDPTRMFSAWLALIPVA